LPELEKKWAVTAAVTTEADDDEGDRDALDYETLLTPPCSNYYVVQIPANTFC
jgi:hypothetical protein